MVILNLGEPREPGHGRPWERSAIAAGPLFVACVTSDGAAIGTVSTMRAHDLLARGLSRREYGSGEVIFAQGDANTGVYCVSSGAVAIRRLDAHGNSVLLGLAYPGDTVGYRSFLAGSAHRTSAEALGPSYVCHIARDTVAALLEAAPSVGLHFLKRSIGELEHAHDKLFRQATLSNRDQLRAPASHSGQPAWPPAEEWRAVDRASGLTPRSGFDDRHPSRDDLTHHRPPRNRWHRIFFRPGRSRSLNVETLRAEIDRFAVA